ncbi:MAG: hypothetical protein ACD_56C00116G0001 [uncultured bacterium]|nr:MAG: hypothetical protein ACD_56C00116G0001 [uncultured bacterium]
MSRILETIISIIFGVVEFFLGFRFLFRLFGASESAPFVRWLYETTEPLLNPFRNMFPAPRIEGVYVVEFTTLVALLIYMLIGYLILELVAAIRRVPRDRISDRDSRDI